MQICGQIGFIVDITVTGTIGDGDNGDGDLVDALTQVDGAILLCIKILEDHEETAPQTVSPLKLVRVEFPLGDVNRDGRVNRRDLCRIWRAMWSREGHRRWDPNSDLNDDGKITRRDLWIAICMRGETADVRVVEGSFPDDGMVCVWTPDLSGWGIRR